jgi:hypothetical protein
MPRPTANPNNIPPALPSEIPQAGTNRPRTSLPGTWAIIALPALLALAAWPFILLAPLTGRGASDQVLFHEKVVRSFAAQWPRANLADYLSATTPGYHLALALVDRTIGAGITTLRFAGSGFSMALLCVLAWICLRELGASGSTAVTDRASRKKAAGRFDTLAGWRALVVCLPLAASAYVFFPAVYLQPDNAGWLFVAIVLALGMARLDWYVHRPLRMMAWWASCAAAMLAVVFTRQSHVWVGGVLLAAAYAAPPPSRQRPAAPVPVETSLADLFTAIPQRLLACVPALVACFPAALVLWHLSGLWGGLVPPRFQSQHASANPTTPALALALLALYSVFFAGFLVHPLRRLWTEHRWLLIASALAGLLLAIIPVTTYVYPARGSGIWGIVRVLDSHGLTITGRTSPLFVVLSPLGAVALCAWMAIGMGEGTPGIARRSVILSSLLGFVLAQTSNSNAWQRYLEPGLLMFMAVMACWGWDQTQSDGPGATTRVPRKGGRLDIDRLSVAGRWLGPIGLTVVLAAVTALTHFKGEPIDPKNPPPMPPEVWMGPLDQLPR